VGAEEAGELLVAFVAFPIPALEAAIALWVRAVDATDRLVAWARGLPPSVESGFMPTRAEADAWADRHALGLIRKFPLDIDHHTGVVLASALATKVSWQRPFDVVSAADHLGRGARGVALWSGCCGARIPVPAMR
jgi:hypothetical protein